MASPDSPAGRPRLATSWLPQTRVEWLIEVATATVLIFGIFTMLRAWPELPARVPRHFNAAGKPDAWGGKQNLWVLQLVSAILYTLLTVVSRFPHTHNFPVKVTAENAPRLYRLSRMMLAWLKAQMVCVFSYLSWGQVQVALGRSRGLGWAFLPVTLAALSATVYYYVRRFWEQPQ